MNALRFNRSNCTTVLSRLGAYLDGELRETGRRQVEAHVVSCGRCAGELQRLQALGERLRSNLAISLPEQDADLFWEKVERKIREAKAPRWWRLDRARELFLSYPGIAWGSVAVVGAAMVLFAAHVILRPLPRQPARVVTVDLSLRTVVESVEGGPNSSVFLLSSPDQQLKIIWVVERENT
jgi:anti-sigma factor RsiW